MKKILILCFAFLLFSTIVAADLVCCEQTVKGDTCQYVDNSKCAIGSKSAPTNCVFTSFCKPGCCFNMNDGRCYANMPLGSCNVSSGNSFGDNQDCDLPQCELGCCIIGNEASLITQTRCKKETARYPDLQMIFKTNITDETSCVSLARSSEKGCCVIDADTCTYTARGNCALKTGTDLGAPGFFKDRYCSEPNLICNCVGKDQGFIKKGCLEGTDDVYYFDSCGNPESIAENCDYVKDQTVCGTDQQGDYDCLDLNCKTKYDLSYFDADSKGLSIWKKEGVAIKNGESWCEYDTDLIGFGKDVPGSRYYKGICINNKVIVEGCKDYREEFCLSSEMKIGEETYREAACRVNRWQDCATQKSSIEDCEDSEIRDCTWKQGSCYPFVPPGSKFWESENLGTCSQADSTCVVTFAVGGLVGALGEGRVEFLKDISGGTLGRGWECISGCDCLKHDYLVKEMNECRMLGDCGANYNILVESQNNENLLDGFISKPSYKKVPDHLKDLIKKEGGYDALEKIKFEDLKDYGGKGKTVTDKKKIDQMEYGLDKAIGAYVVRAMIHGVYSIPPDGAKAADAFVNGMVSSVFRGSGVENVPVSGEGASLPSDIGGILKLVSGIFYSSLPNTLCQCTADIQCAEGLVCNQTSKTCIKLQKECTDDNQCAPPLKYCDTKYSNKCVQCTDNIHCEDNEYCDTALGSGKCLPTEPKNKEQTTSQSQQEQKEQPQQQSTPAKTTPSTRPSSSKSCTDCKSSCKGNKASCDSSCSNSCGGTGDAVLDVTGELTLDPLKLSWKNLFPIEQSRNTLCSMRGIADGANLFLGVYGLLALVESTLARTETVEVVAECNSWQPPSGKVDCEACNAKDDNRQNKLCSEYTCRSFGQTCNLINKGTENETCVSLSPRDVNSPIISTWKESLVKYKIEQTTNGYKYTEPISAFTYFPMAIKTDEPAECRMSLENEKFEDMELSFGSNQFLYEHLSLTTFPTQINVTSDGKIEVAPGKEYVVYVKCQDPMENKNERPFTISFKVKGGPDVTPPVIEGSSIASGSYVRSGINKTNIVIYVNEPAECRWSRTDEEFEKMNETGKLTCATNVNKVGLYECTTTLSPIIDQISNIFYFRCKDQPSAAENDRNVNAESYVLDLRGSFPLKLDYINPLGEINTRNFTLEVGTSKGATLDGVSYCYYDPKGQGNMNLNQMIQFLETNASVHRQVLSPVRREAPYNFSVICVDYGLNLANGSTSIIMKQDVARPYIIRIYKDETYTPAHLKLIMSENVDCQYKLGQDFTFGSGISMGVATKGHDALYEEGKTYYIRCVDPSENSMLHIFHT